MIAHELTYVLKLSLVLIEESPRPSIVKQEQEAFDGQRPLHNEIFLLERIKRIPS